MSENPRESSTLTLDDLLAAAGSSRPEVKAPDVLSLSSLLSGSAPAKEATPEVVSPEFGELEQEQEPEPRIPAPVSEEPAPAALASTKPTLEEAVPAKLVSAGPASAEYVLVEPVLAEPIPAELVSTGSTPAKATLEEPVLEQHFAEPEAFKQKNPPESELSELQRFAALFPRIPEGLMRPAEDDFPVDDIVPLDTEPSETPVSAVVVRPLQPEPVSTPLIEANIEAKPPVKKMRRIDPRCLPPTRPSEESRGREVRRRVEKGIEAPVVTEAPLEELPHIELKVQYAKHGRQVTPNKAFSLPEIDAVPVEFLDEVQQPMAVTEVLMEEPPKPLEKSQPKAQPSESSQPAALDQDEDAGRIDVRKHLLTLQEKYGRIGEDQEQVREQVEAGPNALNAEEFAVVVDDNGDARAADEMDFFAPLPNTIAQNMRRLEADSLRSLLLTATVVLCVVLLLLVAAVAVSLIGSNGSQGSSSGAQQQEQPEQPVVSDPLDEVDPEDPLVGNDPADGDEPGESEEPVAKDTSYSVVYSYSTQAYGSSGLTVTETVSFGADGLCETTSMRAVFSDEESAKTFHESISMNYGSDCLEAAVSGTTVTAVIDISAIGMTQQQYEDALRGSVEGLTVEMA